MKRKKQNFHRHKIKTSEPTSPVDFASIKERTILSLVHLGEQLFSEEPGGYSFENWMTNFNGLLDEFEEHVGIEKLPTDYFNKRHEVTSSLVQSMKPSEELDSQITKLREEDLAVRNALSALRIRKKLVKETEERRERLKLLEADKDRNTENLEIAKFDLAEKRKIIQDSSKLFKRLFGSPKTLDKVSLQTLVARVADIEAKIEGIEKKILEQKKRINYFDNTEIPGEELSEPEELQSKSDLIHSQLEELEQKKFEELQMLEKRREATNILQGFISKIDIGQKELASVHTTQ